MEDDKKPTLYAKLNMNEPSQELIVPDRTNDNVNIDRDFDIVQKNLSIVIETGQKALDEISDIATQSQDPEAYTTVASMINSLVAANRELLDAYRRRQAVKKDSASAGNTNVVNINLTTAELAKMLQDIPKNG